MSHEVDISRCANRTADNTNQQDLSAQDAAAAHKTVPAEASATLPVLYTGLGLTSGRFHVRDNVAATGLEMVPMTGCTGSCVNGRCINGTCMCNAGWSGNQDIWTQDLSRWGGPNLNCPTPIYVLQVAWAVYLFFAALLWLIMPISIRQQWQKFRDLKKASKVDYWFQHFPLTFLLIIYFLVLPSLMAGSIIKLTSKDLSEVVGATIAATVVFTINHTVSPTIIGTFMIRTLHTFAVSGLDDAASAPALKAFIHAAGWLFVIAAVFIVLASTYPVVSSSKSAFEYQELHKLCAQVYLLQQVVGHFLLSLAAALMGGRVVIAMNGIISNRLDLASRTNQSDILASVASLRRTRRKVASVFVQCSLNGLVNAGLFLAMELNENWFVFIGILFDILPLITTSLSYFSVLSYTTLPTLSFLAHIAGPSAASTFAAGEGSAVVELEQLEGAPLEPNEQERELEQEQARELEPEQTTELQAEEAAGNPQVGRAEGWDIGGPAHLAC
uniref:EGF-like domain-containing protein n=1 Tax=Chrysotila carterae TaxID=13221 RepID=A0A7S4BXE1_CHRCT